jgi:hypothetical protein
MDTTINENEPLTISHILWLGFKNLNGAFERKNVPGEIQYVSGEFHYSVENKSVKHLKIKKDLNDIVIPIANKEIAKRNASLKQK